MSISYKHEPRGSDEYEHRIRVMQDAVADGVEEVTAASKAILSDPGDGFDTGAHARRIQNLVMDHADVLLPQENSPGRLTAFDTLSNYATEAASRHVDLLESVANRQEQARSGAAAAPSLKSIDRNAELMVATAVYIAAMRDRAILIAACKTPGELAEAALMSGSFNRDTFGNPRHLEQVQERQRAQKYDYSL